MTQVLPHGIQRQAPREIADMVGEGDEHSKITVNLLGELRSRLRGKPCQPRDRNLRVRCGHRSRHAYPDALIVCGPPEFDPTAGRNTTLLNPHVLFEIADETTEAYDRGRKFERYRKIESVEEYVLIMESMPSVDVFCRQPSGLWMMYFHRGLEANARILDGTVELPLSEIYAGVNFPPE